MSGRKSSEVYQLLNRMNGNLDRQRKTTETEVLKNHKICETQQTEYQNLQHTLHTLEVEPHDEAKKAFPSEIEKLMKRLTTLKERDEAFIDFSINNTIQKDFDSIIQKVNCIRESIVSGDYNDAQYEEAARLEQHLNDNMSQLNKTQQSSREKTQKANDLVYNMEKNLTEALQIINQINRLEANARFLREQKEEAETYIKLWNKSCEDFPLAYCDDFHTLTETHDSFNHLHYEGEQMIQQDDVDIIKNYKKLAPRLEKLHRDLEKKHNQLTADKKITENLLHEYEYIMSSKDFVECKTKDEKDNMSLREIEVKYGLGDSNYTLDAHRDEIEKLGLTEQYGKATTKTQNLLEQAHALKDSMYEKNIQIMNGVDNSLRLIEGLENIGYKTDGVEAIAGGDNPRDGYRIEVSAGNDVLHFESFIDADGKYVLDINHLDENGNDATTCERSYPEIRKALTKEGLYINNFTKNGHAVISSSEKKSKLNNVQQKKKPSESKTAQQ